MTVLVFIVGVLVGCTGSLAIIESHAARQRRAFWRGQVDRMHQDMTKENEA